LNITIAIVAISFLGGFVPYHWKSVLHPHITRQLKRICHPSPTQPQPKTDLTSNNKEVDNKYSNLWKEISKTETERIVMQLGKLETSHCPWTVYFAKGQ
jgi:hypothetical protein